MWICLNNSFLSIVADNKSPDFLLVRARRKGDIEKEFPAAIVRINEGTDYKYRASVPRKQVAVAIADQLVNIEYDNFKDSVEDQALHNAYFNIWSAIYKIQK